MSLKKYRCHVCGENTEVQFQTMWSDTVRKLWGCYECGRKNTHEWVELRTEVLRIEKERAAK